MSISLFFIVIFPCLTPKHLFLHLACRESWVALVAIRGVLRGEGEEDNVDGQDREHEDGDEAQQPLRHRLARTHRKDL